MNKFVISNNSYKKKVFNLGTITVATVSLILEK